jgi:hypothetical protein
VALRHIRFIDDDIFSLLLETVMSKNFFVRKAHDRASHSVLFARRMRTPPAKGCGC